MGKNTNGSQHNMIFDVFYRHPCGNMQNVMDFLNCTIVKIVGDFNLDLSKLDSHPVQI